MGFVTLTFLLDKIARVNAQRLTQRLTDLHITPRHVGLLTAAATLTAPSQADLGTWLGVGPSAVVAIVDELESLGAVTRSTDTTNRRRQIITVTATGQQLLSEAAARAEELDRDLLAGLPPDLTEAFGTALRAIAAELGVGTPGRTGTPVAEASDKNVDADRGNRVTRPGSGR
jgi:DNA-binding MarR family transcriptional regulator